MIAINDWWYLILKQVAETDWLQWLAVVLGVAEVLLAKANSIWLYPAGIGATVLSVYILFVAGLYADSLLNGYYIVMSIYGWWYWIKKKNLPPVKISACNRKDWISVAGIIAGSFVMLALLLKNYTPSSVPLWDAWVSATAWAGMWLLAKRKVENWILLNVSNAFAIPLLFYKRIPLFAALTIFLFVIGVQGFIKWRETINAERTALIKI